VLLELGLLEQRHKAVLEVPNGATVTDVARRYGVVCQTLHDWLRRYEVSFGIPELVGRGQRPVELVSAHVMEVPPGIEL